MKRSIGYRESEKWELMPVSSKEKYFRVIKSIFVVLALDYFFYQSLWTLLPLSYIGFRYWKSERAYLFEKKKEEAREQFKEMLLLVSKGQKAGYSADNAFLSCMPEMRELYGKESSICKMLQIVCSARENRQSLPAAWKKIGDVTEITEIREFAGIYEIAQKKSGNVSGAMEKTAEIIAGKIETEKEIVVLLSAKRLEQRIMNLMPFAIMLYMMVTSPGYFDGLYHTPLGVIVMSVCLGIYLAAYAVSLKMVDIRL